MAEQFDMFSERVPGSLLIPRDRAKPSKRQKHAIAMSEEAMVRHLSDTGRYRILKKLVPRETATFVRPEYPLQGHHPGHRDHGP